MTRKGQGESNGPDRVTSKTDQAASPIIHPLLGHQETKLKKGNVTEDTNYFS
jgi:hypothetical protein